MTLPAYQDLAAVGHQQLWGLIEQYAGPAWAATYEYRWERSHQTWGGLKVALSRAAAGELAVVPAGKAPRFLSVVVRERVAEMSTTWRQVDPFGEVRLLEELGLVTLEHDDTYVLAVVSSLGDRSVTKDPAAALRSDPVLRDLVWRFFEVEGGGEVSLANIDKFSGRGAGWQQVLGELVADGTLPRERVLTCCVEALGRDFSAYRAGWFSAFLESLEPDAAELAARQPDLRRLLGSTVTATASMAARALKTVAMAGLLDEDACTQLAPALVGRTKGTALVVLRLLRDIAGRRPDLTQVVAQTVADALQHPHANVQRAAVALLDALGAADLAARSVDVLAPTVRRQVSRTDLGASARADPDTTASATGIGPMPVDLTASALLVPSGRNLTEAVSALLEDAEEPMAVEAALAGLAATNDPDLVAPLAKRAASLLKRNGFAGDHRVRAGFAWLVLVAAGRQHRSNGNVSPRDPELLRGRLDHVADVLAGHRPPGPLLATPTDTDGWVAPEVFVARLAANREPHPADLVGALLRLAHEGRSAALNKYATQEHSGETSDIVRHALGAPPPASGPAAVRTPALWAAASRARDPLADDPLLEAAGLTAPGQAHPVRAKLDVRLEPFSYSDARGTHTGRHARFAVVFDDPPPNARRIDRYDIGISAPWVRWAATTHPHDTEPVFAHLVLNVVQALDYWEADHAIPRALVALSHHPGRIGPLGAITAAAGLAAQEGTHRALGVDAVIALAARGTLPAQALATAMRSIAPATRLPRWAPSLEQVAQAVGSRYVVDVLTDLLPHLPPDTRGLVKLLDVLAEESTRITNPVTNATLREYLESFTTGSAAAAAHRTLAVR